MRREKTTSGRRGFLAGLLTGAGAVAALVAPRGVAATRDAERERETPGPVLYRRTEEAERYYRTLYR